MLTKNRAKVSIVFLICVSTAGTIAVEAPPIPSQEDMDLSCNIPHPECINQSSDNGSDGAETVRDMSQYSENQVFVTSDSDWQKVLVSLPITNWRENGSLEENPVLIYSKEDGGIDVDSTTRFIQNYDPEKVKILGDSSEDFKDLLVAGPDFGAGVSPSDIDEIDSDNLNSKFWDNVSEAVYTPGDYQKAMKAAVYASESNLPLIIEGYNERQHSDQDLNLTCVGVESDKCNSSITPDEALEKYNDGSNNVKTVYTNPGDLTSSENVDISTGKTSADIKKGFYRDSLVSPYLALWRNQRLFINNQNSKSQIDTYLEGRLESRDTLTIVGSPQNIPFREKQGDISGNGNYKALDMTLYSDLDGDNSPDVNVGRIAAPTVTDTSAMVARSVFNDEIAEDNTKTFTASSFDYMIDDAQSFESEFEDSGHDTRIETGGSYRTFDEKYWEGNALTYYLDHGSETWAGISSSEMPEMTGTLMISDACSTCAGMTSYTDSPVYCWQAVRQGANAHLGAVSIGWTGNKIYSEFTNEIYYNNETMGEAFRKAYETEMTGRSSSDQFYWMTTLVGDPNLNPDNKAISNQIEAGY